MSAQEGWNCFWSLALWFRVRKKEKKEREKQRKETHVNWWVSDSVCISHRGSVSGSRSRLTDGAFNWLLQRGTTIGQSSEELMQNNWRLLSLTEGPPLDQIIGRAVDISLPSIMSAEGRHSISHTHPDVFLLASLSFFLMYLLSWCFIQVCSVLLTHFC